MSKIRILCLAAFLGFIPCGISHAQQIPLSEHPRPDFERAEWINLNGQWDFRFDPDNRGLEKYWSRDLPPDHTEITVPFPWGSPLSGVGNESDVAWYGRDISVPESWDGMRTFLVVGACDWRADIWVDGQKAGSHCGGYTPFGIDLTPLVTPGSDHRLVIRVDDTWRPWKLYGKQGYGDARGIWQTIYLEKRPETALEFIHFTADIDHEKVQVTAGIDKPAGRDLFLSLSFPNGEASGTVTVPFEKGAKELAFEVLLPAPHLWELDDPYLYRVVATLWDGKTGGDRVDTYFGMRKISVMDHPATGDPYVALNNRPLYLKLSLDQSYHPEGFYTFPSDAFMRDEIIRSKKIGLNGNRIHIKAEIPRKLYWADRLGLLIMADIPNFWGEPGDSARKEWEYALQEMIRRDYNHPSVFSWVLFNETWGLFSGEGDQRRYLPETQEWVRDMYHRARSMDPSRLMEDNSACNHDHVETDLNSWHAYVPGYEWEELLDRCTQQTYEGSPWNFTGGNRQARTPMLNSECGNVWGYKGSTGDVDWSWDYHIMMNQFRMHPKVAGWLYTEHHDVINEWNGYYRSDRSEKVTGFSDFIPDMTLADLHSDIYLSTGSELCREVQAGSTVDIPLYLSVMTGSVPSGPFILDYELSGRDRSGKFRFFFLESREIPASPWFNGELDPLSLTMPPVPGLYHLTLRLRDGNACIYHLNFTSFLVQGTGEEHPDVRLAFDPASFSHAAWTGGYWDILDGLKVNGLGSGFFQYDVEIPREIRLEDSTEITLVFEASARTLLGKDRKDQNRMAGDYMLGGGTFDPGLNPNAYPMTDAYRNPTFLKVRVNGQVVGAFYLEDDPADHRGVLSWRAQPRDGKLREAGTYGYLCKTRIPVRLLEGEGRLLRIRFEVDDSLPGGLAIYGDRFGRYPFNPTLLFE